MYFYTPKSLEKILSKAGLKVVERIDLPGHRMGSPNIWARMITMAEFVVLKAGKKVSANSLDFVPHFVLVAIPIRGETP